MECGSCGIKISRRKDGYELCPTCYQKALENQRLLWKELAEWTREQKLHVIKVTMQGETLRQESPK